MRGRDAGAVSRVQLQGVSAAALLQAVESTVERERAGKGRSAGRSQAQSGGGVAGGNRRRGRGQNEQSGKAHCRRACEA